ncbi:hypothetical protein H6F32_11685 [Anabaena sp. FACHB-1237]|uniref:hypothetical protein n=1 Tax=Anabaena sp. FACHB-1237 TaxID=2692769 RepID=UPI0016806D95|nr:hypothetical protein [Anabaena sp. FACHB-1237]MBD2138236.1 hypothetical protein [Anabaena sp. FACHB-1237]
MSNTSNKLGKLVKSSLIILSISLITNNPAIGETKQKLPMFADVTIKHSFTPDPLIMTGMSGGSVPAVEISGQKETQPIGTCKGFVDKDPDHTLTLQSRFDYLKLQVESPADTTMIIKGPGGTWCNDDFDRQNPGIVGEWLEGTYKIWVGSYDKDQYFPYRLKITEVK